MIYPHPLLTVDLRHHHFHHHHPIPLISYLSNELFSLSWIALADAIHTQTYKHATSYLSLCIRIMIIAIIFIITVLIIILIITIIYYYA